MVLNEELGVWKVAETSRIGLPVGNKCTSVDQQLKKV